MRRIESNFYRTVEVEVRESPSARSGKLLGETLEPVEAARRAKDAASAPRDLSGKSRSDSGRSSRDENDVSVPVHSFRYLDPF